MYWSFQVSIDEKHGALFCRHSWSEKNDNWPDEAVDSRFTTRAVGNHEHMGATALHGEPSDLFWNPTESSKFHAFVLEALQIVWQSSFT